MCCSVLQCDYCPFVRNSEREGENLHCSTLQRTTAHCNTLHHTVEKEIYKSSTEDQQLHTAAHCNTMKLTIWYRKQTAPQDNTADFSRISILFENLYTFHTATHCNALQHTATHCNALQHTAQGTATHCNTLQHIATLCKTLQHIATHCNALQKDNIADLRNNAHFSRISILFENLYNTLQHTATHCNTLQHSATHYNTLQHTATHCTRTILPIFWEFLSYLRISRQNL